MAHRAPTNANAISQLPMEEIEVAKIPGVDRAFMRFLFITSC